MKSFILTELGHLRKEGIISKKIDGIYRLGKEPNPVQGSVVTLSYEL